jgi:hypothetical protein
MVGIGPILPAGAVAGAGRSPGRESSDVASAHRTIPAGRTPTPGTRPGATTEPTAVGIRPILSVAAGRIGPRRRNRRRQTNSLDARCVPKRTGLGAGRTWTLTRILSFHRRRRNPQDPAARRSQPGSSESPGRTGRRGRIEILEWLDRGVGGEEGRFPSRGRCRNGTKCRHTICRKFP